MLWGPILALRFVQPPSDPPVLTVCEALRNLKDYNGKDVVVVGHSGFTFEGVFLSEHCEPDGRTFIQGHWWLSAIAVGGPAQPTNYSFDEDLARSKLAELMRRVGATNSQSSDPFAPRWVVLFGKLVSPEKLQPHRPPLNSEMKNIPGNGFGANGSVPAELLVRGRPEIH